MLMGILLATTLGVDSWDQVHEMWSGSLRRPVSLHRSLRIDDEEARDSATSIHVFIRDYELDEIELELDGMNADVETSLDRQALGIQIRGGTAEMSGYVALFKERLQFDDFTRQEADAYGVEVGGGGSYRLGTSSDGGPVPVLDYELSASLRYGDGDQLIDYLWFAEATAQIGAGVEIRSFQATAGVVASTIVGDFDIDPGNGDVIEGSNLGGYLRLAYVGREAPVLVRVQAMFGDIHGAIFSFGLRF